MDEQEKSCVIELTDDTSMTVQSCPDNLLQITLFVGDDPHVMVLIGEDGVKEIRDVCNFLLERVSNEAS